ncbi:uncharacterized protein LOC116577903 isoform X3 [Mustela erminea]|uniref:uncharacterized protein LOC116577903 isoform X3 n=1 Tax=Mustela erminea TaxID=36723 RepID=UPI001386B564|nr:uncharacterized protein LOC116577903 isoform X3 [Mustela erminea]
MKPHAGRPGDGSPWSPNTGMPAGLCPPPRVRAPAAKRSSVSASSGPWLRGSLVFEWTEDGFCGRSPPAPAPVTLRRQEAPGTISTLLGEWLPFPGSSSQNSSTHSQGTMLRAVEGKCDLGRCFKCRVFAIQMRPQDARHLLLTEPGPEEAVMKQEVPSSAFSPRRHPRYRECPEQFCLLSRLDTLHSERPAAVSPSHDLHPRRRPLHSAAAPNRATAETRLFSPSEEIKILKCLLAKGTAASLSLKCKSARSALPRSRRGAGPVT